MAAPNLLQGHLLQVFLGNGGTPTETFALLCITSSKSLRRTVETETFKEVDCASPDNLPANVVIASGRSWSLSLSGRADAVKVKALEGWLDGAAHNIQLKISASNANGGGVYQGPVMLTSINVGTSDNGVATFDAELTGIGAFPTFTAAS